MAERSFEQDAPRSWLEQLGWGVAGGAVQGALLGAGFGFWEQVVLWTVGLDSLQTPLLSTVVALYVVTGAVAGAVIGLAALEGAAWLLGTVGLLAGWWLSGKVGMAAEELGLPGWFGVLASVPVGGVAASALAVSVRPPVALGAGIALLLTLLVGLPVNLHLLGAPLSTQALAVDLGVVVGSVLLGGLAAWMVEDERSALAVVTVFAVSGWAMAHNTTGPVSPPWTGEPASSGPPVVLVMIDTLRADHVGAYGYAKPTTPNLDALAARGVRYAQASASAPWTLPSTASLLTGVEPNAHGAGVHDGQRNTRAPIRADVATLAERLSAGGYRTAGVATNPWLLPSFGFDRGFDVYDADLGPAPLPVGVHPLRVLRADPTDWPAYRSATQITDAALDYVSTRQGQSGWFLFVHYMDVHAPHRPPAEDLEAIGGEPSFGGDYDASLHYVDRELGRLLAGLPDSAVVVVTADHGEELSEARQLEGPVPPGTRHGHTLHEELLRVPLIVAQPGGRRGVVRVPVGTVDVAPTIVRLAGLSWEGATHGMPLARAAKEPGRVIRAEAPRYGGVQRSVRLGRHKWMAVGDGRELFDLRRDPGERDPIEVPVPSLEEELEALLPPLVEGAGGGLPSLGAEVESMLEVLGYVDEPATPGEAPDGAPPTPPVPESTPPG